MSFTLHILYRTLHIGDIIYKSLFIFQLISKKNTTRLNKTLYDDLWWWFNRREKIYAATSANEIAFPFYVSFVYFVSYGIHETPCLLFIIFVVK